MLRVFSTTLLLFFLLFVGHSIQKAGQVFYEIIFVFIFALELYAPLYFLGKEKKQSAAYNLNFSSLHQMLHGNFEHFWAQLKSVIKLCLLILAPYSALFALFFYIYAKSNGYNFSIQWHVPTNLSYFIFSNLLIVALPEEIFFRGFIQSKLMEKWPISNQAKLPLHKATILTNLLFAFAHFVGTWQPLRLLTFFPGMLFSDLTLKHRSVLPAILFHFLCNLLGLWLGVAIVIRH